MAKFRELAIVAVHPQPLQDPELKLEVYVEDELVASFSNTDLCEIAKALRNAERYEQARDVLDAATKYEESNQRLAQQEAEDILQEIEY